MAAQMNTCEDHDDDVVLGFGAIFRAEDADSMFLRNAVI
jgi:hypothetical protein